MMLVLLKLLILKLLLLKLLYNICTRNSATADRCATSELPPLDNKQLRNFKTAEVSKTG